MRKFSIFTLTIIMTVACLATVIFAYEMNFDMYSADDSFADDGDWVTSVGKSGGAYATIKNVDGTNNCVEFFHNNSSYYGEEISEPYTFSLDIKDTAGKGWAGCFIRTSVESNTKVLRLNESDRKLPWTENDHSAMAAGEAVVNSKVSASLVGAAGIGLRTVPGKNYVTLFVKTYDLSCRRSINNIVYNIPVEKDLKAEFISVTFEDDNAGLVKVKFDSTLVAQVEYSNLGSYEDELYLEGEYYKTAVIKDAGGNVIAQSDSSIIYKDSVLVLFTRGATMQFDNISIGAYEIPSAPTEKPADPTEKPADPTEKPADPTEKPADPTEKPADPTEKPADPDHSETGDFGIVALVFVAISAVAIISCVLVKKKARV